MAEKLYHDINLVRVSQVKDFRVHNVTTTQRNALAAALDATNEGLHVWDITEKRQYYWTGTEFTSGVSSSGVVGGMVYKGAHTSLTTAPTSPDVGFTYVFTGTSGDLTWVDQTFLPNASIETQDLLIYRGDDTWDILDGDKDYATETTAGVVRIASNATVIAGTDPDEVVVPASLQAYTNAKQFARVFFANPVSMAGLTPLTIEHNLNLIHKDAYIISVKDSTSSDISVDNVSIDQNSLTLTASVPLTGLKVTIIGF